MAAKVILDRSMSLAGLIAGPISVRSLDRRLGEGRSCDGKDVASYR
jgi:hypothetical protein